MSTFRKNIKRVFEWIYYDWKLKYKLIVFFLLITMIPILSVGLFSHVISQKYLEDAEKKSLNNSIVQLNNAIDDFYELYMHKCIMIYSNTEIQDILTRLNRDIVEQTETNRSIQSILGDLVMDIRYPFMKSFNYYGGKMRAELYVQNSTIVPNGIDIFSFGCIEDQNWCKELFESQRYFNWLPNVMDADGREYVVLNQRLVNFSTAKDIAILRLYIPVDRIVNLIEKNLHSSAVSLLYVDSDFNSILTFGDVSNSTEYINTVRQHNPIEGVTDIRIGKERMLLGVANSRITGWKLIYLVPTSLISDKTRYITYITLVATAASVFLCVGVASLLSSVITKRIRILVDKTNRISGENLSVDQRLKGNDEIGQLDKNFNDMIDRINNLIESQYKSKIIINQTKFEQLQEQINPHMLYNTLSMIGLTAKQAKQQGILEVTNNLISFYRGILNRGRIISSLRAEVEMVKRYLDIMRFVYDLDINAVFDIDDSILDYYSIKLFLQPIVENSIIHGIRPKKEGNLIITAEEYEDGIMFVVSDDGVGMDEETVKRLVRTPDEKGYGVSNVIKRIDLFFGSRYGVKIASTPGAGTEVTITIPKLTEEQIQGMLKDRYML